MNHVNYIVETSTVWAQNLWARTFFVSSERVNSTAAAGLADKWNEPREL